MANSVEPHPFARGIVLNLKLACARVRVNRIKRGTAVREANSIK